MSDKLAAGSKVVIYNGKKYVRKNVKLVFTKPSMTKQSHKEECDINFVMRRFEKTGQLPDMIRADARYGDFSNVPDYQESLNVVFHAQEQFAALSAKVRARFDNDPSKFLEFASNPKNSMEMVKLGLSKPISDPNAPVKVSVVPSKDSKEPKAPKKPDEGSQT